MIALTEECLGNGSLDTTLPGSGRLAALRKQYETLMTSILTDHKSYMSRIRLQRSGTSAKLEDLISRCARLETALAEGTKELTKERREKQAFQVRVEEMQTSIEQRIQELRRRLNEPQHPPSDCSADIVALKAENQQLRANLEELKVRSRSIN